MTDRHIVALGGGGFSDWGDRGLLDNFILGLTGKVIPKVCFIGTASGDAAQYIMQFYIAFPATRAASSHVALFHYSVKDMRAHLLQQDVIYVGGGSTVNLLALWRAHGLDVILEECWRSGIILAGLSAGSLCWFDSGITVSAGSPEAFHNGLGLLEGSHCPHYRLQSNIARRYDELVASGELPSGIAADDGAALHFIDKELAEVVAQQADVAGYRICRRGAAVQKTRLDARLLRDEPQLGVK